ncbi:hypothetical protein GWK47_047203 [Chionoecetes opilio]|uniref:Uncharacterized protein n=1 Tax=Chionoecetes opilio TaxID=41210 RepID=A0A8J4YDV6_CHIOP|nr:hypothetical protein GWK47_047203 [Chionoecetes opilio]
MWRVIHSIGRGLRSVRPSQCCPQDCSEEGPGKHHAHPAHHDNEVSKAQAATLRHYSTVLYWSPLTIRGNHSSPGGVTYSVTQTLCESHSSFCQVGEGIHTASGDNGSHREEGRASPHPRCPPWHWQILQDIQTLEKCHSEKTEERTEEEDPKAWRKTCDSQEWREVLQASPTLQALGWGSAAALTWSLYHGWSDHHHLYMKKNEQQTPYSVCTQSHSEHEDVTKQDHQNGDMWSFHRPFKDFIPSERDHSHSPDAQKNYNKYSEDIYEVPDSQCNYKSIVTYKPSPVMPHEGQTQETIIPVYSYQHKFLDKVRKVFNTHESNYGKENHKIEDLIKYDTQVHDVNASPISHEDKCFKVLERADSGCPSDMNQSSNSQTCTPRKELTHTQYREEESNVTKTVSVISRENPVTDVYESEGEEDVGERYQSATQNEPGNNSYDANMKTLHARLFEIVKADHEERFSEMLKDKKVLLNKKPEERVVCFQAGVLAGDPNAAFNLALCYHTGQGVMQDFDKARRLYEASSAAGHGWATYNLAVIVHQGLGGPALPLKAYTLLLQAAQMGVTEAQEALSRMEGEKQQQTVSSQDEEDEPCLRQCSSEPCLASALQQEWSSSYSTGDLQSLLDEEDWNTGDFSTVADLSQSM